MELYQLRTFVAVAQGGNLSRASERLNVSQPAVSAQIKALEEELGLKLFCRSARGMALTAAGRSLVESARRTLENAQAVLDQAKALAGRVEGALRLGRNTDPEFLRLPGLLSHLAAEHPKALVHIDCYNSYEVARALAEERLDAGFAYGDDFDARHVLIPLGVAPLRVVGPPAWRETLERASLDQLADMPWVWFHERCPMAAMAARLLSGETGRLRAAAVINDENTIRSLVSMGHGLSLVRWDEAERTAGGQGFAVWPGAELELSVNLVILARRAKEPGVQALVRAALAAWEGRA